MAAAGFHSRSESRHALRGDDLTWESERHTCVQRREGAAVYALAALLFCVSLSASLGNVGQISAAMCRSERSIRCMIRKLLGN
jgi:hypothetical protein